MAFPWTSILITGATGEIGGALAQALSAPGVTLHLHGRNALRLEEISAHCRAAGATVHPAVLDLCDAGARSAWIANVLALHTPDLVLTCAGRNIHVGPNGEMEDPSEAQALIDLNLASVMALVQAILPAMRSRKSGQIGLISSLAGYFGLPVTPAYSASKAGLKAWGEALRGWLGPEGIKVNVIMPGYVASPMCHAMPGPKPFLWQPERAAEVILKGLRHDRARISFPWLLAWGCWWLAVLPATLSCRILRILDYRA